MKVNPFFLFNFAMLIVISGQTELIGDSIFRYIFQTLDLTRNILEMNIRQPVKTKETQFTVAFSRQQARGNWQIHCVNKVVGFCLYNKLQVNQTKPLCTSCPLCQQPVSLDRLANSTHYIRCAY